jgi:hypothetical protein
MPCGCVQLTLRAQYLLVCTSRRRVDWRSKNTCHTPYEISTVSVSPTGTKIAEFYDIYAFCALRLNKNRTIFVKKPKVKFEIKYVPVGDNGLSIAYDVTVVSPLIGPTLTSTARTAGHAITAAEQSFPLHQRLRCCRHSLIPVAQETFGGWSGMASHQICLIADRQADRTAAHRSLCRNALFRALSVATQRSIARDIIDRSDRLPEHGPLLPPAPS